MAKSKHAVPFDFNRAVTQLFQTPDGRAFAYRVWFWSAIPMVVSILIAVPMLAEPYGQMLALNQVQMEAILSGEEIPPDLTAEMMGTFRNAFIPYLLVIFGPWIGMLMGGAALHRKVLRGQEYPRIPIRLGADEGRIFLVHIGQSLIFVLTYFIGGVVSVILGAITLGFGLIVTIPVLLWLIVYVPVRLGPAPALCVNQGRMVLIGARHVTRGRAGPLFGAYAVVHFGGYIGLTLIVTVFTLIITGGTGMSQAMIGVSGADTDQAYADMLARLRNPLYMLIGVLGIVVYAAGAALYFLSLSGIGSYLVDLHRTADPADAFV